MAVNKRPRLICLKTSILPHITNIVICHPPGKRLKERCGSSQEILFIVLPVSQASRCVQVAAKYSFLLMGRKGSFPVCDVEEAEQKVRKQPLGGEMVTP